MGGAELTGCRGWAGLCQGEAGHHLRQVARPQSQDTPPPHVAVPNKALQEAESPHALSVTSEVCKWNCVSRGLLPATEMLDLQTLHRQLGRRPEGYLTAG